MLGKTGKTSEDISQLLDSVMHHKPEEVKKEEALSSPVKEVKAKLELNFTHNVAEHSIPPVLKPETIEVELQCSLGKSGLGDRSEGDSSEEADNPSEGMNEAAPVFDGKALMDHRAKARASFKDQLLHHTPKKPEESDEKEELTKDDVKAITSTREFEDFFGRAS